MAKTKPCGVCGKRVRRADWQEHNRTCQPPVVNLDAQVPATEADEVAIEAEIQAEVEASLLKCEEANCDFRTLSKAGFKSHMRKHEREANDPLLMPLDDFGAWLKARVKDANATAEAEAKTDELASGRVEKIIGWETQLVEIDKSLEQLSKVSQVKSVRQTIKSLTEVKAVVTARLALERNDPLYIRGKVAKDIKEKQQTLVELASDANRLNVDERAGLRKQLETTRDFWNDLLAGRVHIPSNKYKHEPLVRSLWFRCNYIVNKVLKVPAEDRTLQHVVDVLLYGYTTPDEKKEHVEHPPVFDIVRNYVDFDDYPEREAGFREWVVNEDTMKVERTGELAVVVGECVTHSQAEDEVVEAFEHIYSMLPMRNYNFDASASPYCQKWSGTIAEYIGNKPKPKDGRKRRHRAKIEDEGTHAEAYAEARLFVQNARDDADLPEQTAN